MKNISVLLYLVFEYLLYMVIQFPTKYNDRNCDTQSHNPKKKYDAIINGTKTVSFGAAGYEDYTTHHDEDWSRGNLESAAWMSRYI